MAAKYEVIKEVNSIGGIIELIMFMAPSVIIHAIRVRNVHETSTFNSMLENPRPELWEVIFTVSDKPRYS